VEGVLGSRHKCLLDTALQDVPGVPTAPALKLSYLDTHHKSETSRTDTVFILLTGNRASSGLCPKPYKADLAMGLCFSDSVSFHSAKISVVSCEGTGLKSFLSLGCTW
jgi:hypothetical protein